MKRLVWIALLVSGCVKTDSQDVTTHGIFADIGAQANGTGTTTVHATLYFGNPIDLNFVDLSGTDALIASNGAQDKVMTETTILNVVSHTATFSTDADGAQFVVDFQHSIDGGAPESIATLPAKFAIEPTSANVSRGSPLTLQWGPAGTTDPMTWDASGDCIELATGAISGDTGVVTLPVATFKKRMGTMIADQCNVTVSITRTRDGVLDSHYGKGGNVSGKQTRSVTFNSTP